eukprot:TRINITY_DN50316_c0_g1_i1.p2 TRINITY_DN50316_c0_g1~~TRINITY_DN50316_c0_g1_i1.p2  ORF type:complete len:147 (+),score=41.34 TRINITY_DN50316_c0_g1_i1:75-515(+)
MPTFARLVGGILLAALAWYVSELIKPLFPDEMDVGWFTEVNTAFGLLVGWKLLGGRATGSITNAIGGGLTAAVALLVTALFFQCVGEMVRLSYNKQYDSASEAVVGVFELMVEYGLMLSTIEVWGTLLIGGIAAGFVTEAVSHKFD